ncbi:MAG: zinc metallopeptidase [Lachnospiraceae bacterium]|nr:zinc metallopeptidase [Lachnospiraceae bacterium]
MLALYRYSYSYGYGYGIDWSYLLIILALILSGVAQMMVSSAYNKYSRVRSMSGRTGAQAAEELLRSQGIFDVRVERVAGSLTDHYDPKSKVLRLSETVYGSSSVAAVSVAAHECGHAIQHALGFSPLAIRTAIVPVVNIASGLSWPLILIGFLFNSSWSLMLIKIGILLFASVVLFQLITLPVEIDASRRGRALLEQNHILYDTELEGTNKVLRAAALTYVAGALASILQLLRLIMLTNRRR